MGSHVSCHVIVVAGGAGRRFGGHVPKQFLPLGDKPVMMHSVMQFDEIDCIDGITLVVPPDYLDHCKEMVQDHAVKKVTAIVCGGENRQQSVYNGLGALGGGDGIVLVHDGARPFVPKDIITALIAHAAAHGAATLALPVTDTVKMADDARFVTQTLRRDGLYLVQTPQAFRAQTLMAAHEAALKSGYTAGDDCELVEKIGIFPKIIMGNRNNIKITDSADLDFARFLLERP